MGRGVSGERSKHRHTHQRFLIVSLGRLGVEVKIMTCKQVNNKYFKINTATNVVCA